MSERITEEELFAEIERLTREGQNVEGHTTAELAQIWGISQWKVQKILRDAARAGVIKVTTNRRHAERLDGVAYRVPCYKIELIQPEAKGGSGQPKKKKSKKSGRK